MAAPGMATLSVAETRDGVWSVNERGPSRVAVAYFPSKWGAMKHALRVARAKPRCRIAVLERNGVEQFNPAGDKFDPSEHEALSVREDGEPGLVVDVVEKGYRSNGTILRPARVVVSG